MADGENWNMMVRIIGSCLIIAVCGVFGFLLAIHYTLEHKTLNKLLQALQMMECELQYRMTPLPELCEWVSSGMDGVVSRVFQNLSLELNAQVSPNAELCMTKAIADISLPSYTQRAFITLGKSLGKYDADGQLKGIQALYSEVHQTHAKLISDCDIRLRSYRTLGLCVGVAIVILLF